MTFKKMLAFTFVIIALFTGMVSSQDIQSQLSTQLDSLLLEGNFGGFLSTWEKNYNTLEFKRLANSEVEDYEKLVKMFKDIEGANKDRIEELSRNFLKVSKTYYYKKSEILYKKFISEASKEQWNEALKFYYTANYFREKEIEEDKNRLRKNYYYAERLLSEKKYDDVFKLIDDFSREDKTKPAYIVLRDSLKILYEQLENETEAGINYEDYIASPDIIKQLSISFSYGFIHFPPTEGETMYHETYDDFAIVFDEIPAQTKATFNVQAEYYLNSGISFGVRAAKGIITDTKVQATPESLIPYRKEYFSAGITGTYFFNNKTGFRPYVRLEGGVINVTRDPVELNPDDVYYQEYDKLEKTDVLYPQIVFEFGSEYEFGHNNLFYIGIHSTISNHFGDTKFLGHFNLAIGITAGINIL